MRIRILVLATALGLLGVPFQAALAASVCPPCCAEPCEAAGDPCASFALGSCCEAASEIPATPAKRSADLPSLSASTATWPSPFARTPDASRPPGAHAIRLPSPLRLSVVLTL